MDYDNGDLDSKIYCIIEIITVYDVTLPYIVEELVGEFRCI